MPSQSLVWQVCVTLLQSLAFLSTGVRLVYRIYTDRWWWDDLIVLIPLVFDPIFLALLWLTLNVISRPPNVFFSPWFSSFTYVVIIWTCRISVTLSIGRVIPHGEKCRILAFGIATLFSLLFAAKSLMSIFKCYDPTIAWYNSSFSECVIRRPVARNIANASPVFDLIADVLTVALPLCVLWMVKLRDKDRRLLKYILFSIAILSFLSSITFLCTWFLNPKAGSYAYLVIRMTAQIQAAVSLFVCNLLDITMLANRLLPRRRRSIPQSFALRSFNKFGRANNGRGATTTATSNNTALVLTSIYEDSYDYSMQSHHISMLSNVQDGSTVNHSTSIHVTSPPLAHLEESSVGIPIAGSSSSSSSQR